MRYPVSDKQLLRFRIRDLNLKVPGSLVEEKVLRLYEELEMKAIRFRPHVYFGDEWFSPEGMLAISVPFYLANPRLIRLERRQMREAEGEDTRYFMRLIRHEAGHCFDHAYRVSRKPQWRRLFGSPRQEYRPEDYRPIPGSRKYVRNLESWYAQAHPDEDFAETFATWLDPNRNWRREYASRPQALAKLRFVDRAVREASRKMPRPSATGYLPCQASRLRTTLQKYYAKRKQALESFVDPDVRMAKRSV